MYKLKLYLIRHGKTEANEKRLYCGVTDISLTKEGKEELIKLKKPYRDIDGYYTTGLKRTNETMSILFDTCNYLVEEGFREYNFGDFEMKCYEELKNSKDYINWIEDTEGNYIIKNGESKKQYRERTKLTFKSFINKLIKENKKNVILVCHGGTIGTILEEFYSNEKDLFKWQPSCGRGYVLNILVDNENIRISSISNI